MIPLTMLIQTVMLELNRSLTDSRRAHLYLLQQEEDRLPQTLQQQKAWLEIQSKTVVTHL